MRKKFLLGALLIFTTFSLCGCANKTDVEKTTNTTVESESEIVVSENKVEEVKDDTTEKVEENKDTSKKVENKSTKKESKVEKKKEKPVDPFVEYAVDNDAVVNIKKYIPNIVVNLKYATTDNFTGKQIYDSDMKAQLRFGTLKKLAEAQKELNKLGYTIVIWDACRPVEAQFKLYEAYPDHTYVANPNIGYSSHNYGNTVDITIETLDGKKVEMPTGFDDFSTEADRNYDDVSEKAAENSRMLEKIMEDAGFKPYSAEWWHFSDTVKYDVVK